MGDLYVKFCLELNKWCTLGELRVPAEPKFFRAVLLRAIQNAFEEYIANPIPEKFEATPEKSSLEVKTEFKARMQGTVTFIAKLICEELLASKLILVVCEGLLKDAEIMKLECLVAFIFLVGPVFDMKEDWNYLSEFRGFLVRLMDTVQSRKGLGRVKFLVMNLVDTRKNGWKEILPQ